MTSAPTGLSTQALTRDHRPEAADERERVEAAGGRVTDRGGKGPLPTAMQPPQAVSCDHRKASNPGTGN